MKVKICGITDMETAKRACEYGADALGFVFAESKRKITPKRAEEIIQELPANVLKIGVFVNESVEMIQKIADECGLTHVQLHGDEDNYQIRRLNIPSIKSLGVTSESDMKNAQGYETDYILFDSPKEKFHGGNGKTFSWGLLAHMPKELREKTILAGGLNTLNIEEAIRTVRPYMVDVSSGVETEGKKDVEKIKQFIIKAKECSK
ncbi:N-(5'phosphoribosyl)anthranilate isomerase [Bacillus paranthracis]|uniref:N-(5'phosphoribosyl)anthranilate isomerase n=1 Tax=Bacillus paranthracis TaxID=2026186 RepID=UPI000200E36B|nr:N-(5'phosphoribosyl)anthranilate isomerase [Bacillus paranthracis]ADY20618.1 N-(5'-phosphoribosyl)anthranilate isomerase [Bacillus thuringiensis serovar finitimus YBT-020]MRC72969.1 N-(5'phosphoribosyl)anthranilate isomerase [Bacillus thuringiensis]OTX68692.1 N-(5'-phosphoribosyl)anthranilate isomerase [Bacillus thuringiensis serovar finitimus]MCR6799119.1 N-(5'phosphoribosyl)anthranilate isomerase [Bacillus paranthracis]MEC3357728.1 N-(5'phosphoribosyl)anthranilate isomerase [Bacillus para